MLFLASVSKKFKKPLAYAAILGIFGMTLTVGDLSHFLGANVLSIESHDPFDGTVYPYEKTVDWTALTDSEREMDFNSISASKLSAPYEYNERNLAISFDDLDFSSAGSNRIRNERITYSVPYMGNYKLDGIAGAGGHPAVDIKLLMRTPIVSIANGIVTDVQDRTTGFGKYVVVRHDNVPDVENPGNFTTYYASYSHLDESVVNVGEKVNKGDLIGYNGSTGTSSTPHVHFQIDTADAPFHPYWPFTWQEAQDAGLSFYEAVNAGLGSEKGRRYTVNPMDFVEANLSYESSVGNVDLPEESSNEAVDEPENDNSIDFIEPEEVVNKNPFGGSSSDLKPNEETISIDVPEVKEKLSLNDLEFKTPSVVLLGDEVELTATVNNSNLLAAATNIDNKITSSERADLKYSSYLSNGDNEIDFRPRVLGKHVIEAKIDGRKYSSDPIDVRLFYDVESDDVDILKLTALKKAGIVQGDEGDARLYDEVNRAASLTFLIRTIETAKPGIFEDVTLSNNLSFNDVSKDDWFEDSIKKAVELGSIDSSRASFNPERGVNLVELLKMYFEAMGADIDDEVNASYADYFDVDAWYAPYLQEALMRNIITTEDLDNLEQSLTRRDVAVIAYKFLSIIETGRYVY